MLNPPTIMFALLEEDGMARKDTLINIRDTKVLLLVTVSESIMNKWLSAQLILKVM